MAELESIQSIAERAFPDEVAELKRTRDTERINNYLMEVTGIGGGNDPVGFLISSHAALMRTLEELSAKGR